MDISEFSNNLARVVGENGGRAQIGNDGSVEALINASGAAVAWRAPASLSPDSREAGLAAKAIMIGARSAGAIARVNKDDRLSDSAKTADAAKIANEASAELAKVVADVDAIVAAHASIDARDLAPPALAPNDIVGGLLDRELRDYVRGLTIEGHNTLAQSLIKGGDSRMLDALQRSPIPLPAVLAAVVPAAREAALLKDNPAFAKQASDARGRNEWLAMVVAQAHGALPRAAGSARQQLDAQRDATLASRG